MANGKLCDSISFRRLLGRLTSAVQCYPIGRQRLHAAWRASRACYRLRGGAIAVSKAVQQDLHWWAAELRRPGHKGVPLASVGAGIASHDYADASGEGGWAAWMVADGELLYAYGEWTEDERKLLIICEKELLASTWVRLVAFAPWLQRTVVSWTDNTVAMAAMRSMAPRSCYRLRGGAIAVSKAVQQDLHWWAAELRRPGHERVPLASAGGGIASHVYADASGEGGWAAWTVADGELL